MAIGTCEGIDFNFTVVIFPKDYETLSPSLKEDTILLVDGNFKCSLESGEISIIATGIKSNTISTIRNQANDMNLFDSAHRVR